MSSGLGLSVKPSAAKIAIVVGVHLVIALIHALRMGTYFRGALYTLHYSYFSDIIVPLGMYFLLSLNDFSLKFLRPWWVKASIVFGIATFTEVMQAWGIHLLGETFDPLDIVMFAVGVLAASLVERRFLARLHPFWSQEIKVPTTN